MINNKKTLFAIFLSLKFFMIEFTINGQIIDGGDRHSIMLCNDGEVYTCGNNDYGQLGDGTIIAKTTPIQVAGLSNITAVAAGIYFSLALRDDSTVWAWGDNEVGQLGDSTGGFGQYSTIPVQVKNLSNIVAISAGHFHALALGDNGTVWAWGANYNFLLGVSDTSLYGFIPKQVLNITNATMVKAGGGHSLVLTEDCEVWGWGGNRMGQLGNDTILETNIPVQVTGVSNCVSIAVGNSHSLALRSDGTVWAWGENNSAQLGNGQMGGWSTFPINTLIQDVVQISAGWMHSFAIKDDETAWGWGKNNSGELGQGTTPLAVLTPKQVLLSGVQAIAGADWHSIALNNAGTATWGFGWNTYGQLGNGATIPANPNPLQMQLSCALDPPALPITLDIVTDNTSCSDSCNGSATVISKSGTPPYTYLWSNGQSSSIATNLCEGIYSITINDKTGKIACIDSIMIKVDNPECNDFFIPNTFSPNNDGSNDVLLVRGNNIQQLDLIIYNRFGQKVFETNTINIGWNGFYKGKKLNSGIFGYAVEIEFENGQNINAQGTLTLIK